MKAIECTKYGSPDVLKIVEMEKPIPKDNEVLIKISATTVTSGDARIRGFNVPPLPWIPFRLAMGLTRPRKMVLGFTVAGEIESVGKKVKRFVTGDQVFGSTGFKFGAYAQYICLPENGMLVKKPENLSYEEATAGIFGETTALDFLRRGNIRSGQTVLIYGASGSVGTAAVQLAKYFGAHVTGVCSTANLEMVKSLGADEVVDYTLEDYSKSDRIYDIIFDTVGYSPFSGSVKSLNKNGHYLRAVNMELVPILKGLWTGLTTSKKIIGGVAAEKTEDLILIKELFETEVIKPVIDRSYPLEQIAEAHRYVDQGHKKGNVVITVQ